MFRFRFAALAILFAADTLLASAEVSLPRILSSHMVIQRNQPVHVWGKAAPGESVSVQFRHESRSTITNELGYWSLYLSPGADGGPFSMTVRGSNVLTLDDILVGDVWVASGQSNMEFEMRRAATAATDLPQAANPKLRLLIVNKRASEFAQDDLDASPWMASTAESATNFSAVAWYFAREIAQREHVPVGIIDSTWGGTVGESWTRLAALGQDASLMPLFVSRGKMTDREVDALLEDKYEENLKAEAKAQGKPEPQFPWHPMLPMWAPGLLYNGMIAPLTPFPIRGVIWYQGESNSSVERAPLYGRIFRTLIEDWRRQWRIGDFPFIYVQLANYKAPAGENWPTIREAQLRALELRNTAMAVTIDIGNPDNVHPTDKLDVGLRLSRAARALAYSEPIEYSGPLFRQATPEGGAIRVWFDHATGLTSKGGSPASFEVAGADAQFFPATATIDGTTVIVSSSNVPAPIAVRYGWANNPKCNLYNSDQLPASPFTSQQ
ncbi:MAG: sialate O-acetylesterase [Acidobacteriaceae bacterium]|nr:sialate O-acetylesterase [Acidobacteriaceae bacterium]